MGCGCLVKNRSRKQLGLENNTDTSKPGPDRILMVPGIFIIIILSYHIWDIDIWVGVTIKRDGISNLLK